VCVRARARARACMCVNVKKYSTVEAVIVSKLIVIKVY